MDYTVQQEQIRIRSRVAVAAYAYEYLNQSIISDAAFDKLCLQVDSSIDTGHEVLDKFFTTEFKPDTGMWIHKHPEKELAGKVALSVLSVINKGETQ